jgi:pheromone shutdown protein TraB
MFAVTYYLPTGALSTLLRGIALAAVIVFAVVVCAVLAPLAWPLCCTIAAGAVTCVCNAAVCAVTMAMPFVIMRVL